jgi:hypothetical protein
MLEEDRQAWDAAILEYDQQQTKSTVEARPEVYGDTINEQTVTLRALAYRPTAKLQNAALPSLPRQHRVLFDARP